MDTQQLTIGLPKLVSMLPVSMRQRALNYLSPQAAINYCLGRLMLKEALVFSGLPTQLMEEITYTSNKKPLLDGLFFNISHTDDFVALAYSTQTDLGLDVETARNIRLSDFKAWFRPDEWHDIISDPMPEAKFLWYWVRKEAILKATALQLSALKQIYVTHDGRGHTGEGTSIWYMQELELGGSCAGVLATEHPNIELILREFRVM